jgi:hypothetical protein
MCIIINHDKQGKKGEQNEGSLKTCHPQTCMLDADSLQKPNWPNPERNIGITFFTSRTFSTNWDRNELRG